MKSGYRSNKLVALEKVQKSRKKPPQSAKWLCRCDCGNEKVTLETSLYNGSIKSCGCHEYKGKKIYDKENLNELMKEKIESSISINEKGCWIWNKSKHRQGYGNLNYKKIPSLAHRVSWMVYVGEIPNGIKVCHRCDIPSCVNPQHLFLGTQKDNVNDAVLKGKFEGRRQGKRRNKLTINQVNEIRHLSSQGKQRKELEKLFCVSQTCIAKILTGVSWKKNCDEYL